MRRGIITTVGLVAIGGAAIFVGRQFLQPAAEEKARREEGLTHAYSPRQHSCRVVEDHELPEELPRPPVGADWIYVAVVVLYPGMASPPPRTDYLLDRINGVPAAKATPSHSYSETAEEGVFVHLFYRVQAAFEYARLSLDGKAVLEKVTLE